MTRFTEEWKPVVDFEGWYAVSSLGHVCRVVSDQPQVKKTIKPYTTKNGYQQVSLMVNYARRTVYVHRLVAAAFIGACPEGMTVNHIDSDKSNNVPSNLEYVTASQNTHFAWRDDLCDRGERHKNAVLNNEAICFIRQNDGVIPRVLMASKFSVSRATIDNVVSRRSWKHVL